MSFNVSCLVLNHALMLISFERCFFFNRLMIQIYFFFFFSFFAYAKILQTSEMLLEVREVR